MFQIKARLVYNQRVRDNYLHCALRAPKIAHNASPGQFVNVRLNETFIPLLRRPLSIHKVSGSNIEFLYEVIGPGTEILAQKKPGAYLDVIGPLGNGFDYRLALADYTLPILIAGGMGVAPLIFLAEKLAEVKSQKSKVKSLVLIGAKNKNKIICIKEFRKLGCEVKIATDDGSLGFRGKVTELLKKVLPKNPGTCELKNSIYACGPRPMLREIAFIAKRCNIPAQVSLEEHMACGIGACLGCAVNTKQTFKRVCKEGPVFNAAEIVWE
jgi:dihydroorotate dehydrogenase electron transfer subunit